MNPNDRAVQPYDKPADTVSADELRQRELQSALEEQAADLAGLHSYASIEDFLNEDADVPSLLDPLVAYDREAVRYRAARPRRRMTAKDLT